MFASSSAQSVVNSVVNLAAIVLALGTVVLLIIATRRGRRAFGWPQGRLGSVAYVGVGALLVCLWIGRLLDPQETRSIKLLFGVVCCVGVAGVAVRLWLRRLSKN